MLTKRIREWFDQVFGLSRLRDMRIDDYWYSTRYTSCGMFEIHNNGRRLEAGSWWELTPNMEYYAQVVYADEEFARGDVWKREWHRLKFFWSVYWREKETHKEIEFNIKSIGNHPCYVSPPFQMELA